MHQVPSFATIAPQKGEGIMPGMNVMQPGEQKIFDGGLTVHNQSRKTVQVRFDRANWALNYICRNRDVTAHLGLGIRTIEIVNARKNNVRLIYHT